LRGETESLSDMMPKRQIDVTLGLAFPGGSTTPVPTLNLEF
jgi:hypothetical protein